MLKNITDSASATFLIGAFRSASGYIFRLRQMSWADSDVMSDEKRLLSLSNDVSAVYCNFEYRYNSK